MVSKTPTGTRRIIQSNNNPTTTDSSYLLDYAMYNLPVVGNIARGGQSAKYASDLKKNTGRDMVYPGLFYSNAWKNAVSEGMSLFRGGRTSKWM